MLERKRGFIYYKKNANLDRWMISYADFVTLLFAFFTVLYAISQFHESAFDEVFDDFQEQFKEEQEADPELKKIIEKARKNRIAQEQAKAAGQHSRVLSARAEGNEITRELLDWIIGQKLITKEGYVLGKAGLKKGLSEEDIKSYRPEEQEQKKKFQVHTIRPSNDPANKQMQAIPISSDKMKMRKSVSRMEIELDSNVLFTSGRAELSYAAIPILRKIALSLKDIPNPVRVEGYTDNIPTSDDSEYPSNWELSAARAASVVKTLITYGVHPSRLAAIGYGQYQPIATNKTARGRKKNRRVLLVIYSSPDEI